MSSEFSLISIIIPARNEEARLADLIRRVLEQEPTHSKLEVVVVDDGSTDQTSNVAEAAGARAVRLEASAGNPGRARNLGAAESRGDPLIFLDADCPPRPGWLENLLAALANGVPVVGGSLAPPPSASAQVRCDYYTTCFHLHPGRMDGPVVNHTPANLVVRRVVFEATSGFTEAHPVADGHEELKWQQEVLAAGGTIHFVPQAVVEHHSRAGWRSYFRRSYRWGYSAVQSKAESGAVRWAWIYRYPWLVVALGPLFSPFVTLYVVGCWLRAGVFETLWMAPAMFAGRLAYAGGMALGGWRWLRRRARVTSPDIALEKDRALWRR